MIFGLHGYQISNSTGSSFLLKRLCFFIYEKKKTILLGNLLLPESVVLSTEGSKMKVIQTALKEFTV